MEEGLKVTEILTLMVKETSKIVFNNIFMKIQDLFKLIFFIFLFFLKMNIKLYLKIFYQNVQI